MELVIRRTYAVLLLLSLPTAIAGFILLLLGDGWDILGGYLLVGSMIVAVGPISLLFCVAVIYVGVYEAIQLPDRFWAVIKELWKR